ARRRAALPHARDAAHRCAARRGPRRARVARPGPRGAGRGLCASRRSGAARARVPRGVVGVALDADGLAARARVEKPSSGAPATSLYSGAFEGVLVRLSFSGALARACVLVVCPASAGAQLASEIAVQHHDGQTFVTWRESPLLGVHYRVYRSATPI